jgi:hypothetical protein
MQKFFLSFILIVLLVSQLGQAKDKKCSGSLLVTSDDADTYEQYQNNVEVFQSLKVQVSNELLDCADEIWIEAIDSNSIRFAGPNLTKTAKLKNAQFKEIKAKKGIFKIDLDERITQLWLQLTHYSLFPAGDYDSKIKISLISDDDVVEDAFLALNYYSSPKMSLELDSTSQRKISGSNGEYQIDLGQLTTSARFDWGINVLSNGAYDIVLYSEFKGLRHETNLDAIIDYTISFDNVRVLSSEQLTRRYDFAASVKNTWFGFSFVLGNVELMPAGNYQDNLSLTIYPR